MGLFTIACGDFLEDYSQDLTYASSCADLEELLIGNGYMKQNVSTSFTVTGDNSFSCPWIHVMDDDAIEPIGNNNTRELYINLKSFIIGQRIRSRMRERHLMMLHGKIGMRVSLSPTW